MAPSRKRIVDSGWVGEPPKKMLKDAETIRFVIYDFKNRNEAPGQCIKSPVLKAHGYEWIILVYPRGNLPSDASCSSSMSMGACSAPSSECLSCYLALRPRCGHTVTAACSIRCRDFEERSGPTRFDNRDGSGDDRFLNRQRVLERYLEEDGSLIIEMDIRLAAEDKRVWYPPALQRQECLVDLYRDAQSEASDVSFSVEGRVYKAHKTILSLRGKNLYEISREYSSDGEECRPIPIPSMKASTFKSLLDFVYTVQTPDLHSESLATEILVAADRYDCAPLKLYAESVLVDRFLAAPNAAALLLLADAHSCALLKEAAMKTIAAERRTVQTTEAWSRVEESNRLLQELFYSVTPPSRVQQQHPKTAEEEPPIEALDVTTLREKLAEARLELDGSREVLVDRYQNHRRKFQVEAHVKLKQQLWVAKTPG